MEEALIVDGYNVIHAWSALKSLAQESLEDARDQLLRQLADFQGYTGMKVIVVFDGYKVKGNYGTFTKEGAIEVYYTGEGETADTLIEKLTTIYCKDRLVRVATSDYDQQKFVFGQGAYRISSRELATLLKSTQSSNTKKSNYTGMNRDMLESRLTPNIKEKLEKIRREK